MPAVSLNPFNNDAFSMTYLTEAILRLPYNMYGRVGELGLFQDDGIPTNTALIEEMGGVLNLIPTTPRGAPAIENAIAKRKMRAFAIPHVALEDVALPSEVSGVRAFGSMSEMDTISALLNRKLQTMKNKMAITLEWLRVGALRGVLLDADGTTVLYNFFNEFGITPQVQNFPFSAMTSTTGDFRGLLLGVKRYVEDRLHGEVMTGIRCLSSPEFFDAMTRSPQVIDAYKYYTTDQRNDQDLRKDFIFAGITFEEYRGTATDASGTPHRFLPSGTAQFFPEGTQTTFRTIYAPADFNETVNTIGQPLYAKQWPVRFDRGTDIHVQMNPLPICMRPELLVQGTIS